MLRRATRKLTGFRLQTVRYIWLCACTGRRRSHPPFFQRAKGPGSRLRYRSRSSHHLKPLWVTEWVFLSKSSFPTPNHESLDQSIQEIIDTFASLAPSIPLGPMMFYRYDVWLSDEAGHLLPQAD